jgi:hypothetical protein
MGPLGRDRQMFQHIKVAYIVTFKLKPCAAISAHFLYGPYHGSIFLKNEVIGIFQNGFPSRISNP